MEVYTSKIIDEDTGEPIRYVKLTVEEEYAFAKYWCDLLCERALQSKFQTIDFLIHTFIRKADGNNFTVEEMERFVAIDSAFDHVIKTPIPKLILKPTKTAMYPPPSKKTPEERREWYNRTISRIWWEAWKDHPVRKTGHINIFPGKGMDEYYITEQVKKERRYWEQVFLDAKELEGWDIEPVVKAAKEARADDIAGYDIDAFHAIRKMGNDICSLVKSEYGWDMEQVLIASSDVEPRGELIYPDGLEEESEDTNNK